jgi:hypothetical protein
MTKNRSLEAKRCIIDPKQVLTEVRPHMVRRLALCTGLLDMVVAFCMHEGGLVPVDMGIELDSLETFPRSSAASIACTAELLLL